MLRHRINQAVRHYLDQAGFVDVETPYLIKSTPEGARDFVVPSRMNEGQFYALPQSPQTFKQLLMMAGLDKYYRIVKCFRDEDLRADRQPRVYPNQIVKCPSWSAMIFSSLFEGMLRHLLLEVKGVTLPDFPRISYREAMQKYGSDKPDIRFDMIFRELNDIAQGAGFKVFDSAELVVGIKAEGLASYSRKQLDALIDFVKRPQVGAAGLVWCKYNEDGSFKSSVDKFFDQKHLKQWAVSFEAKPGDLLLIMAGPADKTRKSLSQLRLHVAEELGLRKSDEFAPLGSGLSATGVGR
ncbi:MAG: amino acid--tRNA ligase-related protein [Owenweeksia sp.]|nr:amino acid--tRNA ligase-related protein [Owenweeksia sp.]